ncbi:glycosyltransferase [candidate division KSB3 bacterium]|uniref:Glycosyltransferase n=1 Tax=candidate division KSB3 bacterium TaxID=2044937 RepID=A0A9D5JRR7_9BACT|nr:glycosyltransferase [candidate division KSB3 bacterium]MBD3322958.1 glycosyltransferase [candidate division KSB3 bacterium]
MTTGVRLPPTEQNEQPPLRVMQLVLSLGIGGTEKLVSDIVHRVEKQLVSPSVCCLDDIGYFGERLRDEGFRVSTLHRTPGIDWRLIDRLAHLIQHDQIEVIHAHHYSPYFYGLLASCYTRLRRWGKAPKIVFTEHGRLYPERKHRKRMLCNPLFSLLTDEIVTISESTKASLATYENFPAHRISVVYNGIDLHDFSHPIDRASKKQTLGIPSQVQVIGIVARLDPIKNHRMLLRAFVLVLQQRPETYLLIVGDGPEAASLKSLATDLQIAAKAKFLGSRTDVPDLLQVFDVFALSSLSEGTSVTLLEAMGAGIPIVATRVGGNPEVIGEEQECGYLVPSEDDEAMATKLLQLLRDEGLRQTMGQAGQQRVKAMFSLEKMVQTYTDVYFKVCRRNVNHH